MRHMKKWAVMLAGVTVLSTVSPAVVKAEGWVQRPEGYYYMYDNGAIATNTQVGIFTVGPTGLITYQEAVDQTNRIIALQQQAMAAQAAVPSVPQTVTAAPASTTALYEKCAQIVAAVTTPQMSEIEKTRALFNYMVASMEYKRDYATPTGNWGPQYATEALMTGKGNCYRYAAAYAYLLKTAGLDSRIAYGQIHAARGGLTPHSWTEVNIGGIWYTVDCEMHDAKKGKYDFFMKTMDQYPIKPLNVQGYLPVGF